MRNDFSKLFLSKGVNYLDNDKPLKLILKFLKFLPDRDLHDLGSYVSEELVESLDFIDHHAKPELHTWGITGERIDYVRISPDHARALMRLQEFGVIRKFVSHESSILYHFISGYIVSDSGIFCTLTLTAQTAYAIDKYAKREIREEYLHHFADVKNPWFGATFYSEIQGGSDLGANRTVASDSGNGIVLNGSDKYFASNAGIADAAIVTARSVESPSGAKGISVFLVPAYRKDGSPNYRIRRLKDKLGTVAVPTGEVEFENSECYPIGKEREGIYVAMEILVISRIDDAIAAVGIARKALWEAYLYANDRSAFGKKLIDHPLMRRDFIEREVRLEAATVLSFIAAKRFEEAIPDHPPYTERYQLARLLSNIAKSMAADTSADITRYSLEMMGGIGFMEEFPMAKFHRDSIVTSIWEGTSNIQALEMLEVLSKKNGIELLNREITGILKSVHNRNSAENLLQKTENLLARAKKILGGQNPEFYAKDILSEIGKLASCAYMLKIAEGDSPDSLAMKRAYELYYIMEYEPEKLDHAVLEDADIIIGWMKKQ